MSDSTIKLRPIFKSTIFMGGGDYQQGFEDGKTAGYNEGFAIGESTGFDKGREDGLSEGYQTGKADGYAEGEAYGKANAPSENLSVTLKANGSYSYPKPSDKYHADVNVIVAVPSDSTPTQEKTKTITKNGTEVISPDAGYALSKVTVVTDIPERLPVQTKTIDIDENGTEEVVADNGYALEKVIINTDIDTRLPEQTKEVTIKENGTTNVIPDSGYTLAGVSVTTNIDTRLPEQEKSLDVTENGTYEVVADSGKTLSKVNVNVEVAGSGGGDSGDDNQLVKITSYSADEWTYSTTSQISYSNLIKDFDWTEFNKLKQTKFASFFKYFYGKKLTIKGLDTSNATDMSNMFNQCSNITTLDLSNFDTSKVTDMSNMFYYCSYLTTLDLSNFDTSKVRSISSMFYSCSKLTNVIFGDNWASNFQITTFEMHNSPLSKESILDLATKIADKSDTSVYTGTYTVKLKSSQKSLFTEDELTALANQFTAKNWTLAWSY